MREEEKKRTSQNSNLQKFFRKRWVFPAIYLASAAIILTGVLWFQSSNNEIADLGEDSVNEQVPGTAQNDEPGVPVTEASDLFRMPVVNENEVEIFKQYYDANAPAKEQEEALVFYDNTYYENEGIDIVARDGKTFDVTASLAGTVVKSEKDSLFGHVVEIEHAEGVLTVYQSLADVTVKQGDKVEQGQVIAKAGENAFNEEAATHVHFEIRNNGDAVNPIKFFGKPVTSLEKANVEQSEAPADDTEGTETKIPAEDSEGTETEEPADDEEDAPSEGDEGSEESNSTKTPDASIGMARA